MKAFTFFAALTICLGVQAKQITLYVGKYLDKPENSIQCPTDFAGHVIIDQSQLQFLKGKAVSHVDLVYTKFRQSPDFNQNALNEHRISQLKRLLPQLQKDKPSWSFIEQIDATTIEDAQNYFHGFVIHYSEPLDYQHLDDFF